MENAVTPENHLGRREGKSKGYKHEIIDLLPYSRIIPHGPLPPPCPNYIRYCIFKILLSNSQSCSDFKVFPRNVRSRSRGSVVMFVDFKSSARKSKARESSYCSLPDFMVQYKRMRGNIHLEIPREGTCSHIYTQ